MPVRRTLGTGPAGCSGREQRDYDGAGNRDEAAGGELQAPATRLGALVGLLAREALVAAALLFGLAASHRFATGSPLVCVALSGAAV